MTDLNSLARTLAERLTTKLDEMVEFETFKNGRTAGFLRHGASEPIEAVIREAIEKTIDVAEKVAQAWGNSESCEHHDDNPCCHVRTGAGIAAAIRSLKQSNAVAEDEGPCADCGRPKSDSAMHLDSPSNAAPQPLHWFRQSNSGRAEQGIVRE